MRLPKRHAVVLKSLVEKYKAHKGVIGIFLFGSCAIGKATEKSDIDIIIVFKIRKNSWELIQTEIDGIHVDISIYSLKGLKEKYSNKPYLCSSVLKNKIIYDPTGIIKNQLNAIKEYFGVNKEIHKYWREKEKKDKLNKKLGRRREDFFELCKAFDNIQK